MKAIRKPPDAVAVLTAYLVLLVGLPSRLTFAPLGGAGSPAVIVGLGCVGWWGYWQVLRPSRPVVGAQPVRRAYLVMLLAFLLSYIASTRRPAVTDEGTAAALGMVALVSLGGVLLLANDGPPTRERFETLLRRIVVAGGALAGLAIVQFVTGQAWVDRISIPGLSYNQSLGGLATRDGLNRPAATALHPIELGVVLAMILPLALNLALTDRRRGAVARWAPVVLILFAAFISISRSAVIGVTLGLIVIAARWPRRVRRTALCTLPFFLLALFLLVPGLLGSLAGLFTGIGSDSSAGSRTGSYGLAFEFVKRAPVFGRGFGTFLPEYRILDNEYLLLLIEVGALGLLCTLACFVTAMHCAGRVRTRQADATSQQIAQALKASVAVGAVSLALFDGLGFPMAAGMLFLMVGLCGAAWRLAREESLAAARNTAYLTTHPTSPAVMPAEPELAWTVLGAALLHRWYVVGVGMVLTLAAMVVVHTQPGVYWAQTDVVFLQPQSARYPNSIQASSGGVIAMAGLVAREITGVTTGPSTASANTTLAGEGIRDGYAIRLPDSGGQWSHNFSRAVLDVQVIGSDHDRVAAAVDQLIRRIAAELGRLQDADAVPTRDRITLAPAPDAVQVFHLRGEPMRAAVAAGLVGLAVTAVAASWLDRLRRRPRPVRVTQVGRKVPQPA